MWLQLRLRNRARRPAIRSRSTILPHPERLEDRLCPSGYSITPLPLLPGGTWGYAWGLNNRSAVQVVGQSSLTGGDWHATLWQKNAGGTFAARDLGTLGSTRSWARAINDAGQVAGSSYFSVDVNGTRVDHAFLWTPGGTDGIP